MTADAKVGLLLGLFFIVIIAFLVNGLPNFIQKEHTSPSNVSIITKTGQDIVLDNGTIHTIEKMLTPVVFTSYEWVSQANDFTIFSELLTECGLADTLNAFDLDLCLPLLCPEEHKSHRQPSLALTHTERKATLDAKHFNSRNETWSIFPS